MKTYTITIEEPKIGMIDVQAENIEEALKKGGEMYRNGEIDCTMDGTDSQIMAEEKGEGGESTEWVDV